NGTVTGNSTNGSGVDIGGNVTNGTVTGNSTNGSGVDIGGNVTNGTVNGSGTTGGVNITPNGTVNGSDITGSATNGNGVNNKGNVTNSNISSTDYSATVPNNETGNTMIKQVSRVQDAISSQDEISDILFLIQNGDVMADLTICADDECEKSLNKTQKVKTEK
ncbi:hypothetical protein WDM02_25425, partial [Citrobacter meridianamericanus]